MLAELIVLCHGTRKKRPRRLETDKRPSTLSRNARSRYVAGSMTGERPRLRRHWGHELFSAFLVHKVRRVYTHVKLPLIWRRVRKFTVHFSSPCIESGAFSSAGTRPWNDSARWPTFFTALYSVLSSSQVLRSESRLAGGGGGVYVKAISTVL